SPLDIPAWTNSAMDGYAARASDVQSASAETPVTLRVVEDIAAGAVPTTVIGPGECARIFTGAPVPDGADSVIRQEDTDLGSAEVRILASRDAGQNLRRIGEDIRRGTRVLTAGSELGPAQLGVLASMAVSHPMIVRRPRVAILASGDELADLDQPDAILSGMKVASSNTHTLVALVRRAGAEPVNLGIARDDPADLTEKMEAALAADLVITSAGISVGEHDYVRKVVGSLGGDLRFWRIRMRPGAPVGFGLIRGVPWIGLPGNPVSTMVTFELFVRPAIRWMAGRSHPWRRSVKVRVMEPVTLGPKLQHFLRVVVTRNDEALEARLTGPQGSGVLSSMALANALLIVPEGVQELAPGSMAEALLFDESEHRAEPAF
ncbi:MAG: gephyrin-like molybdotransferase Glp, partial [Gemmatimonadota bacterium]